MKTKLILCALTALILALPLAAQVDRYTDAAGLTPNPPVPPGPPGPPTDTLTFFTDRTAFMTMFPGLIAEDFTGTSVPPGAITACAGPFNSSTNNACFTPGAIVDGIEVDNIVVGGGGQNVVIGTGALGNATPLVGPNSFADNMIIRFNDPTIPVDTFGLDLDCPFGPFNFNIDIRDSGGTSLGTTTALCSPGGAFWGVSSTDLIGSMEFESTAGPGANEGELATNMLFGAAAPTVPQWGMIALIVLLLAASALVLRRRSA